MNTDHIKAGLDALAQAKRDGGVWSARCDCRNDHNSNSGRCNARNVIDPSADPLDPQSAVYCDSCRHRCHPEREAK
jgi:hypothetical protein